MPTRFKKIVWFCVVLLLGAYLGAGPAGEWLVDVWHLVQIAWQEKRARQSGGSTTLLVVFSGFLLIQGLFLLLKRWVSEARQRRAQAAEGVAAWDPSLLIATRFGLHRYLEQCDNWTAEDPTTRIPSLALFKIHGLGALNDVRGTLVATELLQDISTELRIAALPDSAGRLNHLLARYRPRPRRFRTHATPVPRFAARWSGATFALAFRELDAMQAVAVARDFAAWVRREFSSLESGAKLEVRAGLAIGTPGIQPRELATAALKALDKATADTLLTVSHEPSDLRAPAIAQMTDVAQIEFSLQDNACDRPTPVPSNVTLRDHLDLWLRNWGMAVGCFVGAFLLLHFGSSGKALQPTVFSWPDSISEFPVIDATGQRTVRLERTSLPDTASAGFKLSELKVVQATPDEKRYYIGQVHLSIENTTTRTHYVSIYDFQAIDASNRRIELDPTRMVRVANGIWGRWLAPGERWSGWLFFQRQGRPITGLEFQPDRYNYLATQAK